MSLAVAFGARSSQHCFRLLLGALANPGLVVEALGPEVRAAGAATVALALADIGTPVAIVGDERLAAEVAEATRAPLVPVSEALLVVMLAPTSELLSQCARGSALAPERGAKVGLACQALAARGADRAPAGNGGQSSTSACTMACTLQLSGPGVPGTRRLSVGGLGPDVFGALRQANAEFPAGVDAWLFDKEGRVAGIPRSVVLEVS